MKLLGSRARPAFADLAFFAGWTDDDLRRMERFAEAAEYEPGEVITTQGRLAVEFVVIESGRAAVIENGRPTTALGAGDTVGELSMLGGTTSSVVVVAQTYLKALVLGPREFNGLLAEAPSMGRRLATLLAARLRERGADRRTAA